MSIICINRVIIKAFTQVIYSVEELLETKLCFRVHIFANCEEFHNHVLARDSLQLLGRVRVIQYQ